MARLRAQRAASRGGDEAGAILVLALALLVVGVSIVGAMTYLVSNDLNNSTHLKTVRSLQYAARSATNLAIQNIRFTPLLATSQTLNASPPAPCWGNGATPSGLSNVDGVAQMDVWCSTVWNPASASTRIVTFSTCLGTVSPTQCAARPLLQAVVSYDDYPPGVSSPSAGQCVAYCGTNMALNSWVWSPVIPTVSGISPTTGPIGGGTSLTITGSGFVAGSTVNFVEESGGTPTSDNVVLQATGVTVSSATSITAMSPAITAGSTYFVTVTTPAGTSAQSTNAIFSYTATAPTITNINPTTGGIAGGSAVTVTGTGFLRGATVRFIQESNGSPVVGGQNVQGTYVNVTSSTTLTVVSPGVTTGTTYFITVTTAAGTTPYGANDIFTYSPLVPTVSAVSPSSGPNAGGTPIVITGTGFTVGDTVGFIQESGGNTIGGTISGSNVTVVGTSTITATTPSVFTSGTYYVTVTAPGLGTSSYFPIFTYTG